jgi:hypothetical protein
MTVNEAYTDLENQATTVGLNIKNDKRKPWYSKEETVDRDNVIHLNNTKTETVNCFKYLGSITNTTNDEITEIKRRILTANRAYFSMPHLFKSRTIHQKNKVRILKTVVQPILCYECEICTMTNKAEEILDIFERMIFRQIFGPT